jgi:DNA-binding NarL/FixJ family response regulator
MPLDFDPVESDRAARVRRGPAATRVVVAGDDAAARADAASLLTAEPDVVVVETAGVGDAPTAVRRSSPDLVVLEADVRRPGGRRALRGVLSAGPRVRVVVLSAVSDPVALVDALTLGASGYLLRGNAESRLGRVVQEVMEGRVPLDRELVAALRARLERSAPVPSAPAAAARPVAAAGHGLTARELTVLGFVASGMTNDQIARELLISAGTVKLHVQHIIAKLRVANRTQVAVYAARHGLLREP